MATYQITFKSQGERLLYKQIRIIVNLGLIEFKQPFYLCLALLHFFIDEQLLGDAVHVHDWNLFDTNDGFGVVLLGHI